MVSAASRAAKTLGGSSRNRPSRSMSMNSGNTTMRTSMNSTGLDGSGGDFSGDSTPQGGNSSAQPSSGTGGPLFMDDVQAQYESLSEKLARENASMGLSSIGGGTTSKSTSRKVRWAQTAAIASTMDADNAARQADDDDPDYVPRTPAEILSDLFTKKYTLPVFLVLACVIFMMVHLAGGPTDNSFRRYGSPGDGSGGANNVQGGKRSGPSKMFGGNRQQNVGGGDGFGDIIFSLTPTESDNSMIPTIEVIHHNTPKISPNGAGTPSSLDGNEPGWIVVPTSSGGFDIESDANGGPGNEDEGSQTTLKWNYGAGVPTPDPALLNQGSGGGGTEVAGGPDDGSKTGLKWNYGLGVPTPNPALLQGGGGGGTVPKSGPNIPGGAPGTSPGTSPGISPGGVPAGVPAGVTGSNNIDNPNIEPDNGSPTGLVWNYPDGVPTPNPALLVEVSPPHDEGTPTTLKWGGLQNIKPPAPTNLYIPVPALGPVDPDGGSPTTLKWAFPPGQPTPDPALLKGVPEPVVWGYPPGIPTPDPALLEGGIDTPILEWGYPPGIPTPDPALLTSGGTGVDPVGWNYPPGEPTPDPAYLNGIPPGSDAPTKRNVETALIMPTRRPTPKPSKMPTGEPVTAAPAVTLKVLDVTPQEPRPPGGGDKGKDPEPPAPPSPPTTSEPTPQPIDPRDENGNEIELAPPEPTERPPRNPNPKLPARPPRQDQKPAPQVFTAPYEGPDAIDSFQNSGGGKNPDKNDHFWSGPNGLTIWEDPKIQKPARPDQKPRPDRPDRPDVSDPYVQPNAPQTQYYNVPGGMVIPQQHSCGCCCCQCGGGGMMGGYTANLVVPQAYLPQITQNYQGGFLPIMHLPAGFQLGGQTVPVGGQIVPVAGQTAPVEDQAVQAGQPVQVYGGPVEGTLAPTAAAAALGCPWDCLIDENVGTQGRSNEDDAIYEVFYTNPLNCCGTIVEVGAGDGLEFSTSYFFEMGMNWTTILTEADPLAYAQIGNNRNGTKVQAINGAFCQETSFLQFDEGNRTFQSPLSDVHSSEVLLKGDAKFEVTNTTTKVDCIRLDALLTDAGIDHVNVMIVHVKGDPWAAVRTMDWNVQVDIWVVLMASGEGQLHETIRSALKLHDYVPAAWDIKLWCDTPSNCVENEVWLRKNFHPLHQPRGFLRGS